MEQVLFHGYILHGIQMFVKCRRSYVRNSWELMFHSPSGKDCVDLEPSGGGNNNKMPRRRMSTGCFVSYLEEGDRKQLR